MIFEFIYKTVIIMTDINDALRKLNALNLKENKNNIDKLINLIKTNQKTNKSFNSKQFLRLLFCQRYRLRLRSKKSLNLLSKLSKSCISITHEQSSSIKYKKSSMSYCIDSQLPCLLMLQSISNKYRVKSLKSTFSIRKTITIVLILNIK